MGDQNEKYPRQINLAFICLLLRSYTTEAWSSHWRWLLIFIYVNWMQMCPCVWLFVCVLRKGPILPFIFDVRWLVPPWSESFASHSCCQRHRSMHFTNNLVTASMKVKIQTAEQNQGVGGWGLGGLFRWGSHLDVGPLIRISVGSPLFERN